MGSPPNSMTRAAPSVAVRVTSSPARNTSICAGPERWLSVPTRTSPLTMYAARSA